MLFKFVLFFLLMCFSFETKALEDISLLGGKEIIFSSPFKNADKAVRLKVQTVALSENFDDDGQLLINDQLYPIDQLFMENQKGKYENLASLLNYFGMANTFFIRYYDPDRLDIKAEKARLLAELNSCHGVIEAEKTADMYKELDEQSDCMDKVFRRFLDLFYADYVAELWENYQNAMTAQRSFFILAIPDNYRDRSGTLAAVSIYGTAVDLRYNFIRLVIERLEIGQ